MFELFHCVRMRRVVVGTFIDRRDAEVVREVRQLREERAGLPVNIYQIRRVPR
ncbi:hypothetical protein EDF74_1275 [Stenotrophomonas rhizophila]|uniref:hypothetical protein n=1 Tax=Stenotrophomonas rhizophila TaxID=216778 RepID=UPI000FAD8F05|nr:hypothetical protein [Stenotrophomonas rhizophila]ROP80205.1 hypothetical protein EDF74_1275 [Stenotrophomonas rhizophila]